MARHRLTTIVALSALALCGVPAPAATASSTLLSGYGGPGQGNQAILGSTLIGGAGGSGGGGASGTGGQGGAATGQSVSIEVTAVPRARSGASQGRHAKTAAQARRLHQQAAPGRPSGSETLGRAVDVRSTSAPALGLSGTDVALIVLGFLVLALTAFVTVLLARRGTGRGAIGSD